MFLVQNRQATFGLEILSNSSSERKLGLVIKKGVQHFCATRILRMHKINTIRAHMLCVQHYLYLYYVTIMFLLVFYIIFSYLNNKNFLNATDTSIYKSLYIFRTSFKDYFVRFLFSSTFSIAKNDKFRYKHIRIRVQLLDEK